MPDESKNLAPTSDPNAAPPASEYHVAVLLLSSNVSVIETIRAAIADESDIAFHHCAEANEAITAANHLKATVLLLDWDMPGVEGPELAAQFHTNPLTRNTPLIVLSRDLDPAARSRAFAVTACDYLAGVPDKTELIARVRYHSCAFLNQVQRDAAYPVLRVIVQ